MVRRGRLLSRLAPLRMSRWRIARRCPEQYISAPTARSNTAGALIPTRDDIAPRSVRGQWRPYALSVGLVVAVVLISLALRTWAHDRPPLVLFVLPILISAYVANRAAALCATILAAIATAFLVLPGVPGEGFERPMDLVQWLTLIITGILISALHTVPRIGTGATGGSDAGRSPEQAERALASTERNVRGGFALALLCLCVVGAGSFVSDMRLSEATAAVLHSQQLIASSKALLAASTEAETEERGYVITGDAFYIDPFHRAAEQVEAELGQLRALSANSPPQRQRADVLAPLVAGLLQNLSRIVELRNSAGFEAARSEIADGATRRLHRSIQQQVDAVTDAEIYLLGQRQRSARRSADSNNAVIIGGGVITIAVVAWVLIALRRDFAGRLAAERMMRAAKQELELRVGQRTAELVLSAGELNFEVVARRGAQDKLQLQLQRMYLLQRITRATAERQDLASIYAVVVEAVEKNLPVEFCCVCSHDAADPYVTVISVGPGRAALTGELALKEQCRIAIDGDGLSRCVRGELVYEPDVAQVASSFQQMLTEAGLRSLVAAPLQVEQRVFGVLMCIRRQADSFSSDEREFLRQLTEQVALAAHQTQLYDSLRTAYDNLRRTQNAALLQERLRVLGQMASGVAHDINNAISPVTLYTEALLENEPALSSAARRQIEIIQRAVDAVGQTVGRLRDFSRQRETQLSMLPVDLNELARHVIVLTHARWSDMAQRRGVVIDMRAELAADVPPIMGIETELRDALVNLIFNAVDAMPDGGELVLRTSLIQERASRGGPPAKFVRLEVADTGVGMDEETRRRCIEPFFTTKGERGMGLGLAMVYATMQRHGSDLEIRSAPRRGTRFRFSFPVASAHAMDVATSTPSVLPALNILLVDDDPLVSGAVLETLKREGHQVMTADGGQAGIDAFLSARTQGKAFDVVITDLGMPHVDGQQVSAAVKSAEPSTIVILLTGWGERLLAEGGTPPKVDCMLHKPPTRRALRAALSRCVEQRDSEHRGTPSTPG
jgi:signal transduction histidine kinase/CHASE3 domain sensor protein/ActR/RegA family two-component response regulator